MRNHTEFGTFGAFLKHLRTKQGLTQPVVTTAVFGTGIKNGAVLMSRLENGHQKFDAKHIDSFAHALKCDAAILAAALQYFTSASKINSIPLDNEVDPLLETDLLPLLKKIVEMGTPITSKRLFGAIKAYQQLTENGITL